MFFFICLTLISAFLRTGKRFLLMMLGESEDTMPEKKYHRLLLTGAAGALGSELRPLVPDYAERKFG